MQTVRFGIVGTGGRSPDYYQQIPRVPRAKLVAVCEKHEPLLMKNLAAHGTPDIKPFTSYEKMLKEAAIDSVVILTEPRNFPVLTRMALEAGKHVLCEVPFAQTLADCWDLVVNIERSGLIFQMAEQMRFAPFTLTWRRMRERGELGKIVYAEGQYLHGMTPNRYYLDRATGQRLTFEEAEGNPNAVKSRLWDMFPHTIYYSPHDLSPLLKILDDRITEVSCFASRPQSDVFPSLPTSDIEAALMRTAKGTILRQLVGFTVRVPWAMAHWYHLMGTGGSVETRRFFDEKGRVYVADPQVLEKDAESIEWTYPEEDAAVLPIEAAAESGHGGLDYFPIYTFVQSVLDGAPVEMDVYRAAETAMPAIIAMQSAEQGGQVLPVPDVRPNAQRAAGEYPRG